MGKAEENGWQETPFGPVPDEWAIKPLSDCAVVQTGVAKGRKLKPAEAVSVPYLRVANVQDGYLDLTEMKEIEIRRSELSRYSLEPGDVVLTEGGDFDKLGRGFIWNGEVSGCVHQNHIFAVRPQKDALLPEFLAYLTQSPYGKAYFLSVAHKTTNLACINTTKLKAFPALLPPLSEQRVIAHVLRTVQQAKEATEKVIAAARQLKQSLMRHLFTYGPVPVEKAEQVPLKETEIGQVPEHWQTVPLGDVVSETQYGMSKRGESKGRYPILRMNNLREGKLRTDELQYVDLDDDEFQKFKLSQGDLLFNRTNSFELVGKTSLFDREEDFVFASYLIRVTPDDLKLEPAFANYYLNVDETQRRLKHLAARAVSQSNINATKLRGFVIPLPPLNEQREIASLLAGSDLKIEREWKRSLALESLFRSLLHHLMTGQVRVNHLKLPAAAEVAP